MKNKTSAFLALVFFLLTSSCASIQEDVRSKANIIKLNAYRFIKNQEEPQSSTKEPIKQTNQQLQSRNLETKNIDKEKLPVAIFVPLSGKNKELGWTIVNAATLSLFDNDNYHDIELVLIDAKETPQDTEKAFDEVINRKIKIVIGPIFSFSVQAIEKKLMQNDIIAISLSNNQELMGKTNSEGGIFVGGILAETQIDKLVSYALSRGKLNFAIIAPNNQYGKTTTELLRKIVSNREGNFITSEFYNNNSKEIDRAVDKVINSFTTPNHMKNLKNVTIKDYDRTYPQVIFIPESGRTLSNIVSSIRKQNINERDFQIAGNSQWDDISTINDFNLLGAWFPAPENDKFRSFEKKYYDNFNKFPPRISSIAYDSILAIAKIRKSKGDSKSLKFSDFTNFIELPNNGFQGIDGLFRFLPNGLIQRNLAILEVGNGRFETIEKPNEKFLKY